MNSGPPEPHATDQDPEEDPMLLAVLTGELSKEDPAVSERLASDPEFAKALGEFESLSNKLDVVAQDERAVLERAVPPPVSRRPRLVAPIAVLVAAAAVLLWWQPWRAQSPSNDPLEELRGQLLSASDFEVRMEREGELEFLRWDKGPGLGWFDVVVEEIGDDNTLRPLHVIEDLTTRELLVTPRPWPTTDRPILVRVELHDDDSVAAWEQGSLLLPSAP